MAFSFLSKFMNRPVAQPEVLAVSPDDRFFTSLLCVASEAKWRVRWVRSMESACQELARRSTGIVLYDWNPHVPEWQSEVCHLASEESHPAVILAAPEVDEDLWTRALECGAYDVVPRSGHSDHLMATLRFAWKRHGEEPELAASGAATIVG